MKIKFRIALAANRDADWNAYGFPSGDNWDEVMDAFETLENEQRFWVEGEVEVADEPVLVQAAAIKTA